MCRGHDGDGPPPPGRRWGWLAVPLLGSLLVVSEAGRAQAEDSLPSTPYILHKERACGPMCLSFLDKYLGGDKTYQEVATLCPPGPDGTNLKSLAQGARALGLHTLGIACDADHLLRLRTPAILHFGTDRGSENHFVVCLGRDPRDGGFVVFDPPAEVRSITYAELRERFAGLGIAVSRSPLASLDDAVAPPRFWSRRQWIVFATGATAATVALALWAGFAKQRRWQTGALRSSLVVALGIAPLACSKGVDPAPAASPSPGQVDLGRVWQGTPIKHVFRVANPTTKPMTIEATSYG